MTDEILGESRRQLLEQELREFRELLPRIDAAIDPEEDIDRPTTAGGRRAITGRRVQGILNELEALRDRMASCRGIRFPASRRLSCASSRRLIAS